MRSHFAANCIEFAAKVRSFRSGETKCDAKRERIAASRGMAKARRAGIAAYFEVTEALTWVMEAPRAVFAADLQGIAAKKRVNAAKTGVVKPSEPQFAAGKDPRASPSARPAMRRRMTTDDTVPCNQGMTTCVKEKPSHKEPARCEERPHS
jgi:hypothetical protein